MSRTRCCRRECLTPRCPTCDKLRCSLCGKRKPEDKFPPYSVTDKRNSDSGRTYWCLDCRRRKSRGWMRRLRRKLKAS